MADIFGTGIIAAGEDYSTSGEDSFFLWEQHFKYGIVTDPQMMAATELFYREFEAADFPNDFDFFYLFGFGTALADSINIIAPNGGVDKFKLTFINDDPSRHVSTGPNRGWTPDKANGRTAFPNFYLRSDYDLTKLHLHLYNSTVEDQTATGMDFGSFNSGAGNSHDIKFGRVIDAGGFAARIGISQYPSPKNAFSSSAKTGVGLLDGYRDGMTVTLEDNAVVLNTVTETATPTLNGQSALNIATTTGGGNIPSATLRMISGGRKRAWTHAKSVLLKKMMDNWISRMPA